MGLFDVHAHLTDRRLAAREAEVLANARSAGLTTILSNGLNPADNQAVSELAARSGGLVKPAFGLYPVDAVLPELLASGASYPREGEVCDPEEAIAWLASHLDGCAAVGEVGLDHHWVPEALWGLQEDRFRRVVKLAIDADLPLIVHTRSAEARALDVLVELGARRVNWHCFGGKVKLAQRIAAHGHYLSIPANARRSQSFTRMLETLPRDRLLLETDCPYLGPDREALNEPANVAGTAGYAAELWSTDIGSAQSTLEENFQRLFGFPP